MVKVEFDRTGALEKFARDMEMLVSELATIPSRASRKVANALERLIRVEFSTGTDPRGRTWARLATGEPSHLTKTGNLLSSIRVTPSAGAGVEITVGADYASYHQTGTRKMPKRAILPEGKLPDSWKDAIGGPYKDAFVERARQVFSRRR